MSGHGVKDSSRATRYRPGSTPAGGSGPYCLHEWPEPDVACSAIVQPGYGEDATTGCIPIAGSFACPAHGLVLSRGLTHGRCSPHAGPITSMPPGPK
jgi:hypothetical protein